MKHKHENPSPAVQEKLQRHASAGLIALYVAVADINAHDLDGHIANLNRKYDRRSRCPEDEARIQEAEALIAARTVSAAALMAKESPTTRLKIARRKTLGAVQSSLPPGITVARDVGDVDIVYDVVLGDLRAEARTDGIQNHEVIKEAVKRLTQVPRKRGKRKGTRTTQVFIPMLQERQKELTRANACLAERIRCLRQQDLAPAPRRAPDVGHIACYPTLPSEKHALASKVAEYAELILRLKNPKETARRLRWLIGQLCVPPSHEWRLAAQSLGFRFRFADPNESDLYKGWVGQSLPAPHEHGAVS